MSRYNTPNPAGRAVALRYDGSANTAPIVVASGMGYLAEKILEVAADNNVPVYEDNSLATMLSLGQEIPDALYQAIVEIYVYFLNFDPNDPDKARRDREQALAAARQTAEAAENAEPTEPTAENTQPETADPLHISTEK